MESERWPVSWEFRANNKVIIYQSFMVSRFKFNFSGLTCPFITELLTAKGPHGWVTVFLLASLIHFTGVTFYAFYASGELQVRIFKLLDFLILTLMTKFFRTGLNPKTKKYRGKIKHRERMEVGPTPEVARQRQVQLINSSL